MTPKAQARKGKIKKGDNIKLKSFCTAKEIINSVRNQPMEWEKYLQTIYLTELIFKIYKEFLQLNSKKILITRFKNGLRS